MKSYSLLQEKIFIVICMAFLLVGAADLSYAGYTGASASGNNVTGGYTGPGPDIISVEQAKNSRDDTRVALKGRIAKSLGGERYLFSDGSGSIQVEIDHKVWRGQQVSPEDTVVIHGEVEKEFTSTEIDVETLIKQ